MKPNQKKFSLFVQSSGTIEYQITPTPLQSTTVNDTVQYDFVVDVTRPTTIKFTVTKLDPDSVLQIKKMTLNNTELDHINLFSFLRDTDNQIQHTHGYIDREGEFLIRLRTNAISQNYLNYLLTLTN